MKLESLETKESLIKEFFTWLFNDDRIINKEVILEKETDLTLTHDYMDANIYFPKQISNFFNTKAMKRLGRISQLDLVIDQYPNAYHNRLEHSKGVYNRKLEELLHNFQNPLWCAKIEQSKMKLHLLAELIKMSGHDIGHFPLSHALEIQIFSKPGPHEVIGQRIMLENPEIQSVLKSISLELPEILADLYKNPVLNFHSHDESSYDVDRFDYVSRDNLYIGNPVFIPYSHYQTIPVILNNDGIPLSNNDGSIITSKESNTTIDVYDYSSLQNIEQLLEVRENGYKSIYYSSQTQIRTDTIDSFFRSFLASKSEIGKELRNYINTFSSCNINDIDLSLFLEWDDIKFYSQILEIAEKHENENIRLLATMTVPNMNEFLTLIYSHLGMYATAQNYSVQDKQFLMKIKSLIKGKDSLSQNLKNINFVDENTLVFNAGQPLPSEYSDFIHSGLIYSSSRKVKAYKKSEPIYIRDINNKIYELSNHPNRKYDWDSKITYIKTLYTYVPFLRLQGISNSEIEKMRNLCSYQTLKTQPYKVNMHQLQVGHNIDDCFLEL